MICRKEGPCGFAAWWLLGAGVAACFGYAGRGRVTFRLSGSPARGTDERLRAWWPASMPSLHPVPGGSFACGVRRMPPGTRRWKPGSASVFFFIAAVAAVLLLATAAGVLLHVPCAGLTEVRRPVQGCGRRQIYAAEGAPCATPRSSGVPVSGKDWQTAISTAARTPDFLTGQREPKTWMPNSMGGACGKGRRR